MYLRFDASFFLYAALMVLVMPLDWLVSCVAAAIWHEVCHLIAIYCCTGKWQPVFAGAVKARIPLPVMSRGRELLCALAGPAGGLCLTLLAPWFPKLAICALIQNLYNLLPVYPLDGGRVLWYLTDLLFSPAYTEYICEFIAAFCIGMLLAAGVFGTFCLHLGPIPVLFGLLILLKSRKFPCNARCLAVQ